MTRLRDLLLTLLLIACLLTIHQSQVQAAPLFDGTEHTGPINSNETWTAAGNPHSVNGSVTIMPGVTVTIQPGVIVKSFNNYSYGQTGRIVVQGTLNAIGESANKIVFTSLSDSAPAQWSGIQVQGGTAVLNYVEVRNGGGGGGFMCTNAANSTLCVESGGTLTIQNSYIHSNAPGYDVQDGVVSIFSENVSQTQTLNVQNTIFENNGITNYTSGYYPILLSGPGIHLTLAGNSYANNQLNRILLNNSPLKIQSSLTLPSQTGLQAYEIGNNWTIPSTQTLTVDPGVTLLARPAAFNYGTPLIVDGHLIAIGTESQKIIMDATNLSIGWGGLVVRGPEGFTQLTHTEILHGGAYFVLTGVGYVSNVTVENGARLELNNSRVANLMYSAADYTFAALRIKDSSAVLINNEIIDNVPTGASAGLYAMLVSGSQSRLEMMNNTFSGNFINAVLLGSDGLASTINTLRPQTGLLGYDIGIPYATDTYIQQPNGVLTLEPGTHIRGVSGTYGRGIVFEVQGELHSNGTEENPVVFEAANSNNPASWGGIHINGGSADLYQTHVINAGRGQEYPTPGPYPSLWASAGSNLSVTDSLISMNRNGGQSDVGVLVQNSTANFFQTTFTNLGDSNEADYPLEISGPDSRLGLQDNNFSSSGLNRVLLSSNALSSADFTLIPQTGLTGYELRNTITVPAGISMTVSPDVSVFGRNGAGLIILGNLTANSGIGSPILFTSSSAPTGIWPGIVFDGAATGNLDGVTLQYGGGSFSGGSSYPAGGLVFYNLSSNAVIVRHCKIVNASSTGWVFNNSNNSLPDTLDANLISAITGVGVQLSGTSHVLMTNTVIMDNQTGGVNLNQSGTQLTLLHPTIARNNVYGLRTAGGASATLTNAILARNAVAIRAESGSSVNVQTALWDGNTADTSGTGTINSLNRFNGAAAFNIADGYHLTQYSEATGKAQTTVLTNDLDGSTRPQPTGSTSDLGADEINQTVSLVLNAEKLALAPVWVNKPDVSSNPSGMLLQQYWIRFHYGSSNNLDPAITVAVQDTLPNMLTFQNEVHSPEMSFTSNGQTLTWQTAQPLQPHGTVDITLDAISANPTAGSPIENLAVVTAGTETIDLSATTNVPVFTPLVTWPVNGELCALNDHSLSVEGSAQPGTTIEIYEGATFKGQAVTNSQGLFKVNYNASQAGLADLTLNVRACISGQCSGYSQVDLSQPQSFWDPQRSWWEGDPSEGPMTGKHLSFKFRNRLGLASTKNFLIPGVYGFWDTTLHLFACEDPATHQMPTQIWITADSNVYVPVSFEGNMYTYKIGAAHKVTLQATYKDNPPDVPPNPYDPPPPPDPGEPPEPEADTDNYVLKDPDGYVFNSLLGFDPANPTEHVIPGLKVTCMAYLPGWGGWVIWPAHLYENQINPQILGSNGYFSFFTPPGQFYIQVDSMDGYQSWRSQVVTVVNDIVHVNIPLTPSVQDPLYVIRVSKDGFSQSVLNVPLGARVRWDVVQGIQEDSVSLLSDIVNPLLRLVSTPDPFASTNGWDSGRLYPGQSYSRQFDQPGSYTYTDSAGHTATINVGFSFIYVPFIKK